MNSKYKSSAGNDRMPSPKSQIRFEKITPEHLERQAIVYVRQSTPQQLVRNQESTQVQYSLKMRAANLGWHADRIVVVDDDQGQSGASVEGRLGFQHVVSEVTLGHVGIVLGVETSRLARSCDDWYPLLKVCGLFGTLIGDLDGVYDPAQYNDRLLLGLKGTMSEAELHILKQRMYQGRLNKARRGDLISLLPIGYVRRPSGEVSLDPDEQVQQVIRLVFRKFDELGTQNAVLQYLGANNIQLGVRIRSGPGKGEIEWRRPMRTTINNMLKNPMYAGAYTFGRHSVDPRSKVPGKPRRGRKTRAPEECRVFLKDRFPSYITWDQFERNQARLDSNRSIWDRAGAARRGSALMSGLLVCARCQTRMVVQYQSINFHRYICCRDQTKYGEPVCQGVSGPVLDRFIVERVLEALRPSALDVSLEAAQNIERERMELDAHWKSRLERASYDADRAARFFRLVDPENRLVARQLEREWEDKLDQQRKLEDEHDRFIRNQPRALSEEERARIRDMAENLPDLWNAPTTTDLERKEILRQVVDRVIVDALTGTEKATIEIHWAGGTNTRHEIRRPVNRLEQLSYFPRLVERLKQLVEEKQSAQKIADRLNSEGFKPAKGSDNFSGASVRRLLSQLGLVTPRIYRRNRVGLGNDEWRINQLAAQLHMPPGSLYHWLDRGLLKVRRIEGERAWAIYADEKELERLLKLREHNMRLQGSRERGTVNVASVEKDMALLPA